METERNRMPRMRGEKVGTDGSEISSVSSGSGLNGQDLGDSSGGGVSPDLSGDKGLLDVSGVGVLSSGGEGQAGGLASGGNEDGLVVDKSGVLCRRKSETG